MPEFTQRNRPMRLSTPLGEDKLLLVDLDAREAISRPFRFELEAIAENATRVEFERLLGEPVAVTLELPGGGERHFHGVVRRVAQGSQDRDFTEFRLTVVPKVWLLTRRRQSRIFQQQSVPDVLREVLTGLDVDYQLQGSYEPRNYCVQYRESDFDFASRLMEEEGIFYYFRHTETAHTLVVADSPSAHGEVPGAGEIRYEPVRGGVRAEARIHEWHKAQSYRSGKVTLRDHAFELPHQSLEAERPILSRVRAGTVEHRLDAGGSDAYEVYDYPGGYAKRFDGIGPSGAEQASELQKIMQDNQRTAGLRVQRVATPALEIRGTSDCRQLVAGHRFTVSEHFDADGVYVLGMVRHRAREDGYRSGEGEFSYSNRFRCHPHALPFRPARRTRRPRVRGCQTAVVVGAEREEIFTDKYGRIKVQFHWDRHGTHNADSSCWVRVATSWAGKHWGMVHLPRVGQEVVVDFLEGDPDRPLVVGSVYNAEQMPPYTLPEHKTRSGVKTRSSLEGSPDNFNEIRFEDKKGEEAIYVHAERNLRVVVERNESRSVGQHSVLEIDGARGVMIRGEAEVAFEGELGEDGEVAEGGDTVGDFLDVDHDRYVHVGKDQLHEIEGNDELVVHDGDHAITVESGNQTIDVEQGNQTVTIGQGNQAIEVSQGNRTVNVDLGKITEEALQGIELKVGQNSIKIDQTGITLKGMMVKIEAQTQMEIKGLMTQIKGTTLLKAEGLLTMIN